MGSRLELYVFCHESGHMLFGWPDLYGFGDYCLMGNAQSPTNPVGINDFYRADQGWVPQIDITPETNARYSATPNGGGFRYVNPKRNTESFFWSNVQNAGRFKSLRGSGFLVLHFDKRASSYTMSARVGPA
jgi:M6 family metalloprotease-like protein